MKKKRICCIVLSLMLTCCEGLTMTYAEENSHSVMDWFWQHTSGQTDTDEQNVQAETTQEEMVQSEVTQDESVQSEAAQSEMVREETAQNEVVQDKAAQAETEQNETVVLENIGGAQEEDIFSQLPREFETFNNSEYGNGFRIGRNGSFWEDSEERYSSEEGIVHVNQFEGKFTKPEKVSDYVYSMHIESFDMENPAGTEYYKNDEKYIVSEPHGFDKADEFYIFLPGVSVDELPEQFISCCPGEEWDRNISSTLPEGVYGIYNVNAEKGFIGASDDHIWSKYYSCDYQGREIEVRPYFNIASELSLWPEGTGQVIYWKFAWPIDNLTESATCEFEAYDENGSGNYYISLYLSEDMSRISVDIASIDGTDLSYWGGTADGTLSAELGLYGQALPDETVQSEAAQAEAIQDGAAQAETEQNETGELENIGG